MDFKMKFNSIISNKSIMVDNLRPDTEDVLIDKDLVWEITIKELKKSKEEFFKLSPNSKAVYIVNHYDRGSKSYSISPSEDCNKESFIKSNRKIYIGFTY